VQRARFQDLYALADLLTHCFHNRPQQPRWVYGLLRLGVSEDLRQRLKNTDPYYVCWTVVESPDPSRCKDLPRPGEVLVATAEVDVRYPSPWQEGWTLRSPRSGYPYLSNLAVRQEARRQGIARQLLQVCEQTAHQWGFPTVYLHVLENNQPARQLYEQLGYEVVRVDRSWDSWLLGRPRHIFLGKSLTPSPSPSPPLPLSTRP